MTNNPLSSLAQALQGVGSGVQAVAQDAPPSPQDAPQRTDSPDIGGGAPSNDQLMQDLGGTPSVQTSLPPRPGAVKGLLTNYLDMMSKQLDQMQKPQGAFGKFRQGFSDSALQTSGAADYRLAKQQQVAQAIQLGQNQDYKDLQGQQYAPMELPFDLQDAQGNVLVPRGTKLPANLMEKLLSNQSVQATKQKMAANAEAGKNLRAGYDAEGKPLPASSLALIQQDKLNPVQIPLDAQTAQLAGMGPEMVGQPLNKAGWDTVNKALTAKGYKITDIGSKRVLADRAGNVVKVLGTAPGLVAGVARAEAFSQARAKYTPVEFQDTNTGEVSTGSALDAINSGQAIVTKPNGEHIQSRVAIMNDIKASLGQLKDATGVLDGPHRAQIAAALADPTSTPGKFLQSEIAMNLNEKERDYVINNLNAKEQIYGLRKTLTGGSASSDAQAAAMLKTLPSASTPDSKYANQQLDTALGVLGRLEKTIQQVGPRQKSSAPTSAAPPVNLLKEGMVTTFKNGQSWTLQGGKATQVK